MLANPALSNNTGATIDNQGIIDNVESTINNDGTIDNTGTITIDCDAVFNDTGTLLNNSPLFICAKWDGGGGDGLWSTAANWIDDTLPTSSNIIRLSGNVGTIHLDMNFTIGDGVGGGLELGTNFGTDVDVVVIDPGYILTLNAPGQTSVSIWKTGKLVVDGTLEINGGRFNIYDIRLYL